MTTLPARIAAVVDRSPAAVAIVDGGRRIGYGELWRQAQDFAALLRQQGLRRNDRVAIILPNRIEAVVACYGIWLAGGVAVPLNVQARERDFLPWLSHCGAAFVVHEQGHADAMKAIENLPVAAHAIGIAPGGALPPSLSPEASPAAPAEAGDLALILYTSGTTGAPKGVMLSHANLLANVESVLDYLQLTAQDSVLSVLPFYYAYGASVLHTHLASGACVHLAPNLLFPHQIVETIARERISGFSGVPSTYALLLDRVALDSYDLGCLRYLTQAGGAMTPALTRRLRTALPDARLFVMYGQTEATSRLTWLPPERLEEKLGAVGIPVRDVELSVMREDGSRADIGETGDVWVRGPNVMRGYWNNPELTASVLHDGWLRTGDMGYLDGDGYLFLAGRRSDMIKTGAHRVHPNDIEEAIAEVPGVTEVAVVGIEDEILGQVVKAFVVADNMPLRGGDMIKAHCRARLAPYKIPRHVEFVSALPRTASGKVRRIQLMEQPTEP